ncbi:hypothetical protein EU555_18485 [Methylobacterium nonmethylotrophicum]|uniref:Uncharacterized protein n=1 Tax=Methylobacterium nonmethylotrophicum TaxID=1141884 RepID=A0A4Z0NM39_9HYPH|nr:hypothetical protein EU555_18485 [Methylobacterium nonmethylotrophicum]
MFLVRFHRIRVVRARLSLPVAEWSTLSSPLWGGAGGGGGAEDTAELHAAPPPPLTPPHKGEGSARTCNVLAVARRKLGQFPNC